MICSCGFGKNVKKIISLNSGLNSWTARFTKRRFGFDSQIHMRNKVLFYAECIKTIGLKDHIRLYHIRVYTRTHTHTPIHPQTPPDTQTHTSTDTTGHTHRQTQSTLKACGADPGGGSGQTQPPHAHRHHRTDTPTHPQTSPDTHTDRHNPY